MIQHKNAEAYSELSRTSVMEFCKNSNGLLPAKKLYHRFLTVFQLCLSNVNKLQIFTAQYLKKNDDWLILLRYWGGK